MRCQPTPHPLLVGSFLTIAFWLLVVAAERPKIPTKFAGATAAIANRKLRILRLAFPAESCPITRLSGPATQAQGHHLSSRTHSATGKVKWHTLEAATGQSYRAIPAASCLRRRKAAALPGNAQAEVFLRTGSTGISHKLACRWPAGPGSIPMCLFSAPLRAPRLL